MIIFPLDLVSLGWHTPLLAPGLRISLRITTVTQPFPRSRVTCPLSTDVLKWLRLRLTFEMDQVALHNSECFVRFIL